MSLTVTTAQVTTTGTETGTNTKLFANAVVELGAITLVEATTDTSSSYDALYRLNGIEDNIELHFYTDSSSNKASIAVRTDSGTDKQHKQLEYVSQTGKTLSIYYYKCANNKMQALKFIDNSGSENCLIWAKMDTTNEDDGSGFATCVDFSSTVASYSVTESGQAVSGTPSIGGLEYLASLTTSDSGFAFPVILSNGGVTPFKGVNGDYLYKAARYPSNVFATFKIGTTHFIHLGSGVCVKT